MKRIAEAEALATMQGILAEVEAGETVVLTRDGKPTIELRRAEEPRTRTQAEVVASILENRKNLNPIGMTSRELIEEGRRY